ncbi:hypothetical protein ACFL5O_00825 [Myxococcota bacterium]
MRLVPVSESDSQPHPGEPQDTPFRQARKLTASTEAPLFGLEWRDAARGRLGTEIPLWGQRVVCPFTVQWVPLLELHNEPHPPSVVPHESWRARLNLEAWWRVRSRPRMTSELGLALEHESDHATSRHGSAAWFLSLNDLALRSAHTWILSWTALTLGTDARLYLETCTQPGSCEGLSGKTTVGGALSLSADFGAVAQWYGWSPFLAMEVAVLAAHKTVHSERRWVAHSGVWRLTRTAGLWQLFLLGFVGHDVGIYRGRQVRQVGAGLRWAPF